MIEPRRPKTIQDYARLKRSISSWIRSINVNTRLAVTGDRNYILERDGTLWMEFAAQRVAVNRWTDREWRWFFEDLEHHRLEERINNMQEESA